MDCRARQDWGAIMNKQDPKAAPTEDIHARIASEAASLRTAGPTQIQDASWTPALSGLLDSARVALEQSIPKSFNHQGRKYWLRVAVPMARMIVFDAPTTCRPMIFALSGSGQEFGHEPCE